MRTCKSIIKHAFLFIQSHLVKMILILSSSELNISVEHVADWLDFYQADYKRILGDDFFSGSQTIAYQLDEEEEYQTPNLDLKQVSSIWFRGFIRHRTYIKNTTDDLQTSNSNLSELSGRIAKALHKNTNLFFKSLKDKPQLPNLQALKTDKMDMLTKAKKVGLRIPKTLVTNNKQKLLEFYEACDQKLITKSLYECVYFFEEDRAFSFKTHLLSKEDILNFEDCFFPSLFQGYVEKEYELRIFYLDGELYSMAIFSQLDEQTQVDFRRYNDEKPNRTVPYQLPDEEAQKICDLMQMLNLSTGSIDMIKTKDDQFVFLEVNPNGQFGMTSFPCNYHLEQKVAQHLIQATQS